MLQFLGCQAFKKTKNSYFSRPTVSNKTARCYSQSKIFGKFVDDIKICWLLAGKAVKHFLIFAAIANVWIRFWIVYD